MAESRLHQLSALGTERRGSTTSRATCSTSGELERMIGGGRGRRRDLEPDHLPEGDLAEGDAYDEQLREAAGATRTTRRRSSSRLAVRDVQRRLRPAARRSGTATDGPRRVRLDRGRPDARVRHGGDVRARRSACTTGSTGRTCFVKIPATKPGLAAIEEMIARGHSINVTLIFSLERYEEVVEAYIRGLERLVESGGDPATVASVASFFVSRVDTEADKRLEEVGAPAELQGQARDRERQARVRALQGAVLRRALGGARGARAPTRSAVCGPRPRPRTRPTATSCTSRS